MGIAIANPCARDFIAALKADISPDPRGGKCERCRVHCLGELQEIERTLQISGKNLNIRFLRIPCHATAPRCDNWDKRCPFSIASRRTWSFNRVTNELDQTCCVPKKEKFGYRSKTDVTSYPELEDVFTMLDLAANSGHHLGVNFAPEEGAKTRNAAAARRGDFLSVNG